MATIRKRGDLQWQAMVRRLGWPKTSRTFNTQAEAKAWASVIESEMSRGLFIDRTAAERSTFGDLLRRYQIEITPSKASASAEDVRIAALLRDPLAQFKAAQLSGERLAAWRDKRLTKVTGSTVNRDLNLISHVVNIANKEWGIHFDNPVAKIRRPKENRARNRRLEPGEEARLLAALQATERDEAGRFSGPQNVWVLPLVVMAIETAARRGELLNLRWEHVNLNTQVAHLPKTKNGEARDIPLSSRAVAVLKSLPYAISGAVFPVSAEAVKQFFTRARKRAGIKNLRFHDLRHEATSRLAERLDNVLELAAVTGHKSLNMLKRYYHPRATDLARKLG